MLYKLYYDLKKNNIWKVLNRARLLDFENIQILQKYVKICLPNIYSLKFVFELFELI